MLSRISYLRIYPSTMLSNKNHFLIHLNKSSEENSSVNKKLKPPLWSLDTKLIGSKTIANVNSGSDSFRVNASSFSMNTQSTSWTSKRYRRSTILKRRRYTKQPKAILRVVEFSNSCQRTPSSLFLKIGLKANNLRDYTASTGSECSSNQRLVKRMKARQFNPLENK